LVTDTLLGGRVDRVVIRLQKQSVTSGSSGEATMARLASGKYMRSTKPRISV
jgi:hypothetical protein